MHTTDHRMRNSCASSTMLLAAITLLIAGCSRPTLMLQGERRYSLTEWDGGTFVFVTYRWHGGSFDEAGALARRFVEWGMEQDLVELPVGRFPSMKTWQLGFIASASPEQRTFDGYPIHTTTIPSGTYARLIARGHPEKLFRYRDPFSRWLERDGHDVQGPVIEVYTDLLRTGVPEKQRMGELRYSVVANSEHDTTAAGHGRVSDNGGT